ncbi:MAG: hypothetical protein RMJ84_08895 [Sandaracinaceae bacterium]|nr:hypothetical protein [Sandaracinaceae bacterium]
MTFHFCIGFLTEFRIYAGQIVEEGPPFSIGQSARHPYTQALLEVVSRQSGLHLPLFATPSSKPIPIASPAQRPTSPGENETPFFRPIDQGRATLWRAILPIPWRGERLRG